MQQGQALALGLLAAAAAGCDTAPPARPVASMPATVALMLTGTSGDPRVQVCVDFRVHRAPDDGTTLAAAGDPTTRAQTVEEARADGAICGSPDAWAWEDRVRFVGACELGQVDAATVVVEGVYYNGVLDETHDQTACSFAAGGCVMSFTCRDPSDWPPPLEFDLGDLSMLSKGFFDLAIDAALPPAAREVCVDMRVTNERGELVWSAGDPTVAAPTVADAKRAGALCASQYGNARDSLSYVALCDAEQAKNTVTMWVKGVYFDPATPEAERAWQNPCPAATPGTNAETWDGGCRVTETCGRNQDANIALRPDLIGGSGF